MNNYSIMILAFLLGQLFYAAISVWFIQNKVDGITYPQAVLQYFKKETAGLVVAATFWAIIMFIASDWIDPTLTREELRSKSALEWRDKLVLYNRTIAAGIGVFAQHLAFLSFKKGKKAIQEYAAKNANQNPQS